MHNRLTIEGARRRNPWPTLEEVRAMLLRVAYGLPSAGVPAAQAGERAIAPRPAPLPTPPLPKV